MNGLTLGVIVGNRGFFPDHLCLEGRRRMLAVLQNAGITPIILGEDESNVGSVEALAEVRRCVALFKQHADEIAGVLVTLPNFGDERGIVNTLREAGLRVPVLVQAFPDDVTKMGLENRRDSFCGKLSACNNLKQYGIPYSLTRSHTVEPEAPEFLEDLRWFTGVCRVLKGVRGARIGALGARPAAFNTVRFSEKLLARSGVVCETLDLSEAFGQATALAAGDAAVQAKIGEIKQYIDTRAVPEAAVERIARFAVVVDKWIEENDLDACAIQCWTSMEQYFGIAPCALMSMLSNRLVPSACETDVTGALGMLMLQLAAGQPAAIVDWNNNYGNDPDKAVLFHCGNLPADMYASARMGVQRIIAGSVGEENAYGTVEGRLREGIFTFLRLTTDDASGVVSAYTGEGRLTADPLDTFGTFGVIEVPGLQRLLRYACENGFEHHVGITMAGVGRTVAEACKYLKWSCYQHS